MKSEIDQDQAKFGYNLSDLRYINKAFVKLTLPLLSITTMRNDL